MSTDDARIRGEAEASGSVTLTMYRLYAAALYDAAVSAVGDLTGEDKRLLRFAMYRLEQAFRQDDEMTDDNEEEAA